jgi:S-adenosylmethionine:tRNA-ribosyltransferase-isomerase (queuine synthetase)
MVTVLANLLDFQLPGQLMPRDPRAVRGGCKLMVLMGEEIEHRAFYELPAILRHAFPDGFTTYLNDSKVPGLTVDRQCVYAMEDGSEIAPTAGWHLTEQMIGFINPRYLTLHVKHGAFRKVDGELPETSPMERYALPKPPRRGEKVLAVGTTVVKALESAALTGLVYGDSDLAILPGHDWRLVDALLTCFQEPRSLPMAMVAAMTSPEWLLRAYEQAIREGYEWQQFGDRMLVIREAHP